jgi:ADP-ribosylglycohydrolase
VRQQRQALRRLLSDEWRQQVGMCRRSQTAAARCRTGSLLQPQGPGDAANGDALRIRAVVYVRGGLGMPLVLPYVG